MARTAGTPDGGPPPGGPYSASTRIGRMVGASGQCGYRPDRTLVEGVPAQTRLALQNLAAALESAGARMDDVLSVEVFLTDVDDFAAMNTEYAEHFSAPYPARTTVYVGLRPDVLVEVSALAVLPEGSPT